MTALIAPDTEMHRQRGAPSNQSGQGNVITQPVSLYVTGEYAGKMVNVTKFEKSLEYTLRIEWNYDEYFYDALDKAIVVAAMKLAFIREHPIICRVWLVSMLCCAWIELGAFILYERGKFFTNFRERAFRKFGCSKIFM